MRNILSLGNAATMIPISHLPSHLSSPVIFSYVFDLKAPKRYSLGFMWAGLALLLLSSIVSPPLSSLHFVFPFRS